MKCQTVIAGVGGQGVLFAAKILTEIARSRNLPVLGSQTFGMAQRGGSVMTHLKMGPFDSPLVCEGEADLLLGLDGTEAHRTLPFLRAIRDGKAAKAALCVVNASAAQAFPDARVAPLLADMGIIVHSCNADAVALDMKLPLVANLVLLGFGASREEFPFDYEEVVAATEALSAPKHRSVNLEALERGRML
jgi:indolepyruvate ferredoxin oxidoreductase beta subunit